MGIAGNSDASLAWKGVNIAGLQAGGCLYPSAFVFNASGIGIGSEWFVLL
jgi:hypothetical protein